MEENREVIDPNEFSRLARNLFRRRFEVYGLKQRTAADGLKDIVDFLGGGNSGFKPYIQSKVIKNIIDGNSFKRKFIDDIVSAICMRAEARGYVIENKTPDYLRSIFYEKRVGLVKKPRIAGLGELIDRFYDEKHTNSKVNSIPANLLGEFMDSTKGKGKQNKIEQKDLGQEADAAQLTISGYITGKTKGRNPETLHHYIKSFFNLYKRMQLNNFLKEKEIKINAAKFLEAVEGNVAETLKDRLTEEELEIIKPLDLTTLQKRRQ